MISPQTLIYRLYSRDTLSLATLLTTALLALIVLNELDRALWLDEILALDIIRKENILSSLDWEIHPPLFYLVSAPLIAVLPELERSIRLIPYIFLVATLLAVYRMGVVLRIRQPILPVALFLSCQEVYYQGQNFRPYTLLALITVLLLHRTMGALFNPSSRTSDWMVVAGLTLLGVLTHYWFVFFCFGLMLASVVVSSFQSSLKLLGSFAVAACSFLILWGTVFFVQLSHGGGGYPADIALMDSLLDLRSYLPRGKAVFVFVVVALLSIRGRGRLIQIKANPAFQFLCLTVLLGLSSAVLVSLLKPVFVVKGAIIFAPTFALAVGWWLSSALSEKVVQLTVVAIALLAVAFSVRNPLSSSWPRTPELVDLLGRQAEAGDVIACELSYASVRYYRDKKGLQFNVIPLDNRLLVHPGWQPREAVSVDVSQVVHRISGRDKFWILFNPKDSACKRLTEQLVKDQYQLKELHAGFGDRFTSILEASRVAPLMSSNSVVLNTAILRGVLRGDRFDYSSRRGIT